MSRVTTRLVHAQSRSRTIQLAPRRNLSTAAPRQVSSILHGVIGLAVGAVGASAAFYGLNSVKSNRIGVNKTPIYADKPTMLKVFDRNSYTRANRIDHSTGRQRTPRNPRRRRRQHGQRRPREPQLFRSIHNQCLHAPRRHNHA